MRRRRALPARPALLLLCVAASVPRATGWAPNLQPANASHTFVRSGAGVGAQAFSLTPAPVVCQGRGIIDGAFTGAGARLNGEHGVGFGVLYLRGSVNASAGWTVLADITTEAVSPFGGATFSEGFGVVVHNDPRGMSATGASFSCLAYTVDTAGPQQGVSGCGCGNSTPPVQKSLAVAVSLYTGCMRLGLGGAFESAEACSPSGVPDTISPINFTLRVSYAPAPPTISGELFTADGSALPGLALRVPLARPLEAVVAGPRAFLSVGAAGGFYLTVFTVAAVGVFTDAPLNLSLAATASAPPPQPGTLPSAGFGDVAGPLAAAVAAAAALFAGAYAACHYRRAWALAAASASSSGGGTVKRVELQDPLL